MKTNTIIAIVLIIVGIGIFAYQGISYTTTEKVADVGPVEITTDKTNTFPLSPVAGGIALAGGIVLLIMGNKKT